MPYTINKSDGTLLTVIQDGTIDTTTSLSLLGRNYSGYGIRVAENFVKILENFSYSVAPASPLVGQLWYDTTNQSIRVWDGLVWQRLANITTAASQPTGNVVGDFWWDSENSQLKVHNGTSFVTIGPVTPSGFGVSGQVVEQILDAGDNPHIIVKEFIDSVLIAVYSKDATFTPKTAITGFTQIKPGYNLSTNISNSQFVGTALNADFLDNLNSTDFLRANTAAVTTGTIAVLNDSGVTIGDGQDIQLRVVNGVNLQLRNQTTNGNISLVTGSTTAIQIDGSTGLATVASAPVAPLGIATKQFVEGAIAAGNLSTSASVLFRDGTNTITGNLAPDTNNAYRLGNVGSAFSNVHSTTFTGNLSATSVNSSSGTFSGAVVCNSLTSNSSISGSSLTVNGTANLRAITAQVNNTFDVGSTTSRFATVYASAIDSITGVFSGNLTTGNVSGATVSGTTASFSGTVSGSALTVAGTSTVRNVLPDLDITYDLGSGGSRFRNVYANSFILSSALGVASGGTGATSLTANAVILGNGVGAVQTVVPGTSGNVLISNGTTWTSQAATSVFGGTTVSGGSTGLLPATPTSGAVTLSGTLNTSSGGTGQTGYTNGQLLIGNSTGNTLTKATLTAGAGISITNGAGSITISSTLAGGTVTSVSLSGGSTGLTATGGPITSSGTITLGGTLSVANGGTGSSSLISNAVILGNGTGTVQAVTPGTSGNVLTSNGTTWISQALPAITAVTSLTATNPYIILTASTGTVGVSIPSSANGFGARTISTSAPTGGADGDIWYRVAS